MYVSTYLYVHATFQVLDERDCKSMPQSFLLHNVLVRREDNHTYNHEVPYLLYVYLRTYLLIVLLGTSTHEMRSD